MFAWQRARVDEVDLPISNAGAGAADVAAVCVANIGPKERRTRMRFGVILLGGGAGLAAVLVGIEAHRLWRLLLFLPFWAGALGMLQARAKT